MIVEIAVVVAFLAIFGIFLACIAVALSVGQQHNRREVRRLTDEFESIVRRLGNEEGRP